MLMNYEQIKIELKKFCERGSNYKEIESIQVSEIRSVYNELSTKFNIPYKVLLCRVSGHKWDLKRALTTKVRKNKK